MHENLLDGKHENYGSQRVWGSIGWGLFTILAGYLVDTYSVDLNGAKVGVGKTEQNQTIVTKYCKVRFSFRSIWP